MKRPSLLASTLALTTTLFAACAGPNAASPGPRPEPLPAVSASAPPAPRAASSTAVVDESPPPSLYDKPDPAVLSVLRAPSPPVPHVNPTADTILMVAWTDYPPMSRVAEPFLRLAGVRLEPKNRSRHDTRGGYGIPPCATSFSLLDLGTGAETKVALPSGCVDGPMWTVDGKHFAFRVTKPDAVELYIGNAKTGAVRALPGVRLNGMLGSSMQWMADQKTLLVKLVPDNAGPAPVAGPAARGPSVQETNGEKGVSSTYEARDTLSSKHDEALFEYYATSQLALVDTGTFVVTPIGKPGIYTNVDAAPDGEHILVETIKRPYSYITTWERFPHDVEIWKRSFGPSHLLASIPLADRVPVHGVRTGPREFGWRSTEPATLLWSEALDGGDWKTKVPARDKVMMQKAPFATPPAELVRTEQRCSGLSWGEKPSVALLHEYDDNRHWTRTFVMNVDDPKTKPSLLWDLSSDERYKAPGSPVYRPLPNGAWVIRQEGDSIFLRGPGASPDGDRPFLDRLDLKTRNTERLFRSAKTAYESFLAFTPASAADGKGARVFLTSHQSQTDPPNVFLRTTGASIANAAAGEPTVASSTVAVTHLPDPTPAVRAIKKRVVKYKRKDGVDLSFTLYTPPGYQEGTKVPAVLYAYPLDFADASKAGQITGSEHMFTRLRQYRLLLLAGYAIIDNASFPIVGDPKKAYDTYLEQLTMDAVAAVDKAVETGVVDRARIGVTGHSHGALMTANLLAHTNLFRAGVATSGSYNKTLTPFGFQNERRSVWEARDVYLKASTFFFADKMKLPILIMHGEDDANPGTTPLQATKLYEAIRGNGGTARLVMLPHEPHWYAALESNEQLIAEMIRWFDKYVKNASVSAEAPKK